MDEWLKVWQRALASGAAGWPSDPLGARSGRRRAGESRPGPKVRRGDVRSAVLGVLSEAPLNGYQVINEIAERTHGAWKPSPGSVYPTIQQLEDEGLIEQDDTLGRRALRLTADGERYVAEHAAELDEVWRPFGERSTPGPQGALPEIGQLMSALWQVMADGTPAQRTEALEVITATRRRLYGILAQEEE